MEKKELLGKLKRVNSFLEEVQSEARGTADSAENLQQAVDELIDELEAEED